MALENELTKEQVHLLIKKKRYQLQFDVDVPDDLKGDIEVIGWVLKHSRLKLSDLPAAARENRQILRMFVKKMSYNFKDFPEPIRDDKELALIAVQENTGSFQHCSERLRADRELVELAMSKSGYYLTAVTSDELLHDRKILKLALASHEQAFLGVPKDLRDDEELLNMVMENKINSLVFKCFPHSHRDNDEIALQAVTDDPGSLRHVSERVSDNDEIVRAAVKKRGMMLEHASSRLRDDKDIVMLALHEGGDTFQVVRYMSERLRNTKEVALAAVETDAQVISSIGESYRDDADIIQACMKQRKSKWSDEMFITGSAYKSFSDRFKHDHAVTLTMSTGLRFPLDAVPESLRSDREIVSNAIKSQASNFQHIPASLLADLDFVRTLYKANNKLLTYMNEDLKKQLFTTSITTENHRGRSIQIDLVLDDGAVNNRARSASGVHIKDGEKSLISVYDFPIISYESDGPVGSYLSERYLRNLVLCGDFVFFVQKNSELETFTNHRREEDQSWYPAAQKNDNFLKHSVYLLDPKSLDNGTYDVTSPEQGGRRLYWGRKAHLVSGLQVFQESGSEYREAVTTLKQKKGPKNTNFSRLGEYALKLVRKPDIEELHGAARVFVDGQGWRWLLPNQAGPFAALELLLRTDDQHDWQWLKEHVATATSYQRSLIVAHFASTPVAEEVAQACGQ